MARYRWDKEAGQLVEIPSRDEIRRRMEIISDEQYQNLVMTDGTVVDSKTKYKAYLKEKGLTHADDFKEHWEKAAKERAAFAMAEHDVAGRTADIVEAFQMYEQGYRPRHRDGEGFEPSPTFLPWNRR